VVDELTGTCLCGGVRFAVPGPFERITACHCESCKKISGGGGTASGRARSADIRILEGAELITTYQPVEGSAKSFCSRCGTNLFGGGWPDTEFCSVRLSALDEPFEEPLGSHIFVRSLAPWEVLPDDGAARYEVRAP
jgi:hypothetical protein